MSHPEQKVYINSVKAKYPGYFKDMLVLDVGSLDINGNNKHYFFECKYLGVDVGEGKNVDIVSKGHELQLPDSTFDLIISTECFEHDQYYEKTLLNIYRMLKPGGLFLFTCATVGRPEHGTRRTSPEDAPLLQGLSEWSDYYKNLSEKDIREVLEIEECFQEWEFSVNSSSHDLYFYGIKEGLPLELSNSIEIKKTRVYPENYVQLFVEAGSGFSQENSIIYEVEGNSHIQNFSFYLNEYQDIKCFRLDPLNNSCIVEVCEVYVVTKEGKEIGVIEKFNNAVSVDLKTYSFEDNDPKITYYFSTPIQSEDNLVVNVFLKYLAL